MDSGAATATYTLTGANGDTVVLAMTFQTTFLSATNVTFAGSYLVTEGTGRFVGAEGGGSLSGSGTFQTETSGIGEFSITGTISPPAGLDIQLYAGLTLRGEVGTVFSIQYVTELAQTNQNAWRCLTFLRLPATNYVWFDASAPAASLRFYRAVEVAAPTNMVFVPPGTFRMGSPTNELGRQTDESPQTDVTISRGFWMGQYEVTQQEYKAVMRSNPSYFTGNSNRPVELVSWRDATNYCGKLTKQERASGRIETNCVYRLATEAEWEYACRALTSTRYSFCDDPTHTNLTKYAWYDANSGSASHPVGQKLPNPWGLYDMHGGIAEWCQDRYGKYHGGTAIDPQGPATGSLHVVRSGAWPFGWDFSRSALRAGHDLDFSGTALGFRVVLAPGQL